MRDLSGLYVITDGGPNLLPRVEQALQAGASIVQYRDKSSDQTLRLAQASAIVSLCRQYGAVSIINDDIDLALEVDADGVHLGKEDAELAHARSILEDKIIGVSCYNQLGRAKEAIALGADYVAFGRFFVSRTKPNAVPASLELLRQAKKELKVSIVAIGGINAGNARSVIEAGADAIAVIDAVFGAPDVGKAVSELVECFSLPS